MHLKSSVLCRVQTLKSMLKENGLSHIQVVVGDGDWGPSDDILKDPSFAEAVDIIGSVSVFPVPDELLFI